MLKTIDVSRAFPIQGEEDFYALKKVNVHIEKGKLTVLVGKSGSGKTTLMNILGALDPPTEGKVLFEGQDIAQLPETERCRLRRKKVGYVFQSVALIPLMTALENVAFALRLAGDKRSPEDRALECLRLVGLEKRAGHLPQELSGGEQQRVAIARAMAHRPSILFADEPTAELDSGTALQVAHIFRDLTDKEGITVVMTTHDRELATIGDKIYALEDGEIIAGN
ncbi:MAG: ABC transporter ATP-binding protein [Eubacteriales bacterium]|nr:ABC transporter ATP-binding protein [Eubacteriales bacterium]